MPAVVEGDDQGLYVLKFRGAGQVPDEWLQGPDAFADPATQRAAYVAYLCQRLAAREGFVQEAIRARA